MDRDEDIRKGLRRAFMKFKSWIFLLLACIFSLFVGYFLRIHYEITTWNKIVDRIRHDFLYEITAPDNGLVMYYKSWVIIKRADGSVVIKRR